MTKNELRQIYLARQKALTSEQRAEDSRRIVLQFFECIDLSKTKLLHCFVTIEKFKEVETSSILRALRENSPKTRIAAPRVNFETAELESVICTGETELVENAWGIREPVDAELIDPVDIDMVLVPGLAFDRVGHRVGYGKGFYDRFLKTCREDCVKVGLSYFGPLEEISDVHEGDTALDLCITPNGIFTAATRRKEELATDKHG